MGFLVVLAGTVTAAKEIPAARIISDDQLGGSDANLACLWNPHDIPDSEQVTVRWYINDEFAKEANGEVTLLSGFEQADEWEALRNLQNAMLDRKEKTEGISSLRLTYDNSFDTSTQGTHGLIGWRSDLTWNISDDSVYTVDLFLEEPSDFVCVPEMRLSKGEEDYIWRMTAQGQPLESGWDQGIFWGINRHNKEGNKRAGDTTGLNVYSFLLHHIEEDFQQTVRFDNFLQYTSIVLESSETSGDDEITCEVIPSEGEYAQIGLKSSAFIVELEPISSRGREEGQQSSADKEGGQQSSTDKEEGPFYTLWISGVCGILIVILLSGDIYDWLKKKHERLRSMLEKRHKR